MTVVTTIAQGVIFLLVGLEASGAPSLMNDDHPDRVYSMPGYNSPLPSKWFSGFLEYELGGQAIHTHYIFVHAEEVGDEGDEDKPLIYWSNGGPGASSMFGLLAELGPLILSDESILTEDYRRTGIPTPIYNPFAWTRLGHVLIVDAPAPVGFSYCNNNLTSHQCLSWTDELAAGNTYLALKTFFSTKLRRRSLSEGPISLYLTGESYAGIYVPTLARRFLEEGDVSLDGVVDLKGFAVGDGCLGTKTGICVELGGDQRVDYWRVVFLASHGQIPWSTANTVIELCRGSIKVGFQAYLEDACQEALDKLHIQVGGFYEYSLYDECTYRNGLAAVNPNNPLSGGLNDYPCGGGPVMEDYVRMPEVQEALNIPPGSEFFEVDNAEGFDYTPTEPDLTGFYQQQALRGELRMLIYNGDTDPSITSFAAQNWTSSLGLEETEEWRPWTVDACLKVAGYVTQYQHGALEFVTLRGAGHLVPGYKPEAAYVMMKSWLSDVPYPLFDKECKSPNTKADSKPFSGEVTTKTLLRN